MTPPTGGGGSRARRYPRWFIRLRRQRLIASGQVRYIGPPPIVRVLLDGTLSPKIDR